MVEVLETDSVIWSTYQHVWILLPRVLDADETVSSSLCRPNDYGGIEPAR
jgi:hypothetical protein